MNNILAGIKVLDLSRILAGPWCTQWLADLGATIYKVERPETGEDMRLIPPILPAADGARSTISTSFAAVNQGKKSITVDLADPRGQALIRELAKKCDVLVENFKGGDLARHGLDYAAIRQVNPDIVYCSITGFGQDGPLASRAGYDPVFQAISGIMGTCGIRDGLPGEGPQRTTVPFIDIMTGMTATSAILGALYHRRNGGPGQFLDIALLDVALAAVTPYAQTFLSTGKAPERQGNGSQLFAPSNCYRCADNRHILIQVGNDAQWSRMCEALQLGPWFTGARFAKNADRYASAAELDAELGRIFLSRDFQELAKVLGDAGVPCGPVNTLAEAFDSPQVRHRGIKVEDEDPVLGRMAHVRSPLRYSGTPVERGGIPALGQDTAAVLQDELGLAPGDLANLRRDGII